MKFMRNLRNVDSDYKKIPFELFIEVSILLVFFSFLLLVNKHNNLLFHTIIELFINFIFIMIFVFTFNTYKINKNNFLLIFGTGHFFAGIIGILHLLTYSGMPFLNIVEGLEVAPQLWIIARYISSLTSFGSVLLLLKASKKINPYGLFTIYFCLTVFMILAILIFKVFPRCFVEKQGLTSFKIISEYIIAFIFLVTAIIYFKLRNNVDRGLFVHIEYFLILSAIAEMFFTRYVVIYDWTNVTGHAITAIAAYFLYKSVVQIGLKRPYDIMNNNLNAADKKAKEFEKVVLENEQCYDFIINNSDNAILIHSEGRFVFANKKIVELLGAEKIEDLMGLEVTNIISEKAGDISQYNINKVLHAKRYIGFIETKLSRLDGQIIDVEATECCFSYHGKPAVIAMFRDISSKKQIARLEKDIVESKKVIDKTTELNTMLTEFFSNISHELKTPLNVILGAIQILLLPANETFDSSTELRQVKYLKTMKQNCFRLLRLVNNIIDLSKFDSGYFKLNLKNYNIVNVVEDISLSVADYIENKGIELIFDTDVEEKKMAVDADKIERIILNLLSNAIKFTNGGGQILVNLWDKDKSVIISIKDTGIGIPQDKLDSIFDRFGQVDKTMFRNHEGSGIGLSLVKSIVDMHGGDIKVFSKVGEGSEFIIELPIKTVEEEETIDNCLYVSKVEKISIEFSDIYI